MPIKVFGKSSSVDTENKIDTTLFLQKHYLRTNYIERSIKEDTDKKIKIKVKIYILLLILRIKF